ncbi:MAG: hypothetical protein GY711_33255 [bacterium]|nr:hypothetical protein [bacterium]
MRSRAHILTVVVVGAASAILATFLGRRLNGGSPDLTLAMGDAESAHEALARERRDRDPSDRSPWLDWPYHLPESVALKLLPELQSDRGQYDPWCTYVYRPYFERERKWEEHPDGKYRTRTNDLGFVRTTDTLPTPPGARVLVTGDSHVDGICNVEEGFPLLLEAKLGAGLGAGHVEVLNGAVSGYSFIQYLGVLERALALGLEPDVFVVTVYAGNDFTGVLQLWRFLEIRELAELGQGRGRGKQVQRQRKAPREHVAPYGQCLTSASYLYSFPTEQAVALDAACTVTATIAQRCAESGTRLLVVILPSPSDLPEQSPLECIERALEYAGLGQVDLERLTQLRQEYAAWLAERDIRFVDLHAAFAAHDGTLFWQRDLHLNLDGHRLAAETVEPALRELLDD